MGSPRAVTLFFLILLLCVSSALYYPRYIAKKAMTAQLGVLLSSSATTTPALAQRVKAEGCSMVGALPDPACTPGAVFENITLEQICMPGYTKTARNVSAKLRKIIYAEYGISYPEPHGSYEVDHLIPLTIGGSNDEANLWPEAADPVPGFKEKDVVEIYLHDEVCAGRVALGVAQVRIASDWLSLYNHLTADQIAEIRARYRNWSN